jgi:hypothetical protein
VSPSFGAPASGTSLHDCQWAVSHNSYDHDGGFDPEPVYQAGYRGFELDMVQQPGCAEWCVKHGGSFDAGTTPLREYLATLKTWSAGRSHEPVFLHLDSKDPDVAAGFPDQLDNYLRTALANLPLFTPRDLMQGSADLMKSAMKRGWPALGDLTGRIVIVLTGERAAGERYARKDPAERLCFTDRSGSFGFPTTRGQRIIANGDAAQVKDESTFGDWCARKRGVLWRLYLAATAQQFQRMAALGPNMIAADYPLALPARGYWIRD